MKTLSEHLVDAHTLVQEMRALPCMRDVDRSSEWWVVDRIHTALYVALKEQDDRVELWIMDGTRHGERPDQLHGPDHVHAHCLYLKIPAQEHPDIWTLSFDTSEAEVKQRLHSILIDEFESHYPHQRYEAIESSVSRGKLEGADLAEYLDDNPTELTQFVRSFFERKILAMDTLDLNNRQPGSRL